MSKLENAITDDTLTNDDVIVANGRKSTCLKRVIVCAIYDADDNLLVCESNRCDPPLGVCARMGVKQSKDNYDKDSVCNWVHAEANAVLALQALPYHTAKAVKAVVYGHEFICPYCAKILEDAGIIDVSTAPDIEASALGCGLTEFHQANSPGFTLLRVLVPASR